jgi:hypothetical protein
MAAKKQAEPPRRTARHSIAALIGAPLVYVLSSGPVLATAFWLRDRTDWDGFYAVMWIYYPLLANYPLTYPFHLYIDWWLRLFGTMPPG